MKHLARNLFTSAAVVTFVAVSGCAVKTEPLTDEDRMNRVTEDMEALFKDQEVVTGKITLSEAMARAIKYNLDYRVKLLEEAMTEAEHNVARMDLLPQMAINAGYTNRSNVNASSSQSITTGLESLETSTSEEKARDIADFSLVWNVLDFGVSYITAKQRSDQIFIAKEKRRKAIQNIMQDVRVAYWQAVSADDLARETDALIRETRAALEESRELEKKGLQPPIEAMQFQEGLLSTLRVLWTLRERLSTSKAELAALMNIRPGSDFELEPSAKEVEPVEIKVAIEELENFALINRPELREADYQMRISSAEVKKAMARMMPGIELQIGADYDSNRFLLNNDWSDAGLRITWNLFNLFSGPANKRRAEAQVEVDQIRRLSLSMAVLSQTNIAYQRYLLARSNYKLASNILKVKNQIAEQEKIRVEANQSDQLSLIRRKSEALVARMQNDLALADLQNAIGRMLNSVGMDPLPSTVEGHEVAILSEAISAHQETLESMLVQPQMDPDAYDEIASRLKAEMEAREAEQARQAAIAAREQALKDKQAAEQAAIEAEKRRQAEAEAAAKAAEEARKAQEAAIAAALAEAEKKRQLDLERQRQEEELARLKEAEMAEAAARAAEAKREAEEAEAARLAAEKAAEEARLAEEAAAKRKAEAEQKLAEARAAAEEAQRRREEEAARIAAQVRATIQAAIDAGLSAGEVRKVAMEAEAAAEAARQRASSITIPEVPEPAPAPAPVKQKPVGMPAPEPAQDKLGPTVMIEQKQATVVAVPTQEKLGPTVMPERDQATVALKQDGRPGRSLLGPDVETTQARGLYAQLDITGSVRKSGQMVYLREKKAGTNDAYDPTTW